MFVLLAMDSIAYRCCFLVYYHKICNKRSVSVFSSCRKREQLTTNLQTISQKKNKHNSNYGCKWVKAGTSHETNTLKTSNQFTGDTSSARLKGIKLKPWSCLLLRLSYHWGTIEWIWISNHRYDVDDLSATLYVSIFWFSSWIIALDMLSAHVGSKK